MKRMLRLIRVIAVCAALVCAAWTPRFATAESTESTDYAALALDLASDTVKQAVTVKAFVDGDTTHFIVPRTVAETGALKARYLAINTPEITGKVEPYGKKAAAFTRERLENAASILIESDDNRWNLDSTGERRLVWVWYQPSEGAPYRNLNIEILQNGLAVANSAAQNRYGDVCMAAIAQAKAMKLGVYSGQRDPDFYYGDAIELTIKELRCNAAAYEGKKVAFKGVITFNAMNSVYVEEYDAETGLYCGIPVYYGYGLNGGGLNVLMVGNESRIVGTLQYYEAGGTYQVSGLSYRPMKPKAPDNIRKISDGHAPAYAPVDAETFVGGTVSVASDDGAKTLPYAEFILHTSVEMRGLTVTDVRVDKDGSGEATLKCLSDGVPVTVRLAAFGSAQDAPAPETYLGKTVDVKGVADVFDGAYQIKVFTPHGVSVRP